MKKAHEGWTNYETHAVAVGMMNNERSLTHLRELVRMVKACGLARDGEYNKAYLVPHLADVLREWVRDDSPGIFTTPAGELLVRALGRVDWREIARAFLGVSDEEASGMEL